MEVFEVHAIDALWSDVHRVSTVRQLRLQDVPYRRLSQFCGILRTVTCDMRRDSSLIRSLREAVRRAARNLDDLKMVNPEKDPELARLKAELSAAASQYDDSEELDSLTAR